MLYPKSDVGSPPFPGKHTENRAVNTVAAWLRFGYASLRKRANGREVTR